MDGHAAYTCPLAHGTLMSSLCLRCIFLPLLYTLLMFWVALMLMAFSLHVFVDLPPAKRRRTLAGTIVSTAVSAALIGTAVGLTVYRL